MATGRVAHRIGVFSAHNMEWMAAEHPVVARDQHERRACGSRAHACWMFVDVHYVSNPEGRTDGILTGAGRQAEAAVEPSTSVYRIRRAAG